MRCLYDMQHSKQTEAAAIGISLFNGFRNLAMLNKLLLTAFTIMLSQPVLGDTLQSQDEFYVVKGRVVDEWGKPIVSANIRIDFTDETVAIAAKSGPDGRFQLRLAPYAGMREPTLYATSERPDDVEFPFTPPFFEMTKKLFPSLAGRLLQLKKEGVDLGDVIAQANYSQTLVRLLDSSGAPFLTSAINTPDVRLRVRDPQGNLAAEVIAKRTAMHKDESTIAIGLPKGEWYIELANDDEHSDWHAFTNPIIVERGGESLRATLRLSTDEQLVRQSQMRSSYSLEQARQELSRLGLAYNNAAFIEQARMGNLATVELFLAAGMKADARNEHGVTALMEAAYGDFRDILSTLLDRGADINAQATSGITALHIAVICHRTAIVEALLKRGANLNLTDERGCTALIYACQNPDAKIASLLLAAGADIKVKDKTGRTASQWAIAVDEPAIVKMLEQARAKP